MGEPAGVIHVVGLDVKVGNHLRQRCAWCGAVIDDVDLSLVMVPIEDADKPFPSWQVGALIEVIDGFPIVRRIVEHADGDVLPDGCCAKLDPAVTL